MNAIKNEIIKLSKLKIFANIIRVIIIIAQGIYEKELERKAELLEAWNNLVIVALY